MTPPVDTKAVDPASGLNDSLCQPSGCSSTHPIESNHTFLSPKKSRQLGRMKPPGDFPVAAQAIRLNDTAGIRYANSHGPPFLLSTIRAEKQLNFYLEKLP
jgi:hypothetical protein